MPLYEHVFMARQDISTAQMDALTDQFKTIITDNGGSIGRTEYWGLKPLTYRIRKNRKAHYAILNITAPAPAVAEMERQMGINEDVIRFMTIRVEEHEEEPSVQMRAGRDRTDRPGGDRGDRNDRGPRRGRDDDDSNSNDDGDE
ncbi:MAG: 30S ribosomal protein S6 [Anderseniella sp.]